MSPKSSGADEACPLHEREVGRRKASEPRLLLVRAGRAHDEGVTFYEGNERVWLTDRVPPRFVEEA